MPTPYDATRQHVRWCALTECCTTAELAARALDCSPDAARAALKLAADAGYLRAALLPGLGNKIVYQPTAKAAGLRAGIVPKFLRAGLPAEARLRGLLRGFVRFVTRPELSFLPTAEQSELCRRYGVPLRGHARALVGLDGAHVHIFVTITNDGPAATIECAASRWLPLLDAGAATLHFVAPVGSPAGALRDTLAAMSGGDLRAELAALDAQITADRSGLAAIKLAAPRAALAAEIAAGGNLSGYSWLGDVVEATL